MSEQVMSAAQAQQVENVFVSRIEQNMEAGFDPVIIPTLIETLIELMSGLCGGDDLTPEQAIAKTKRLSSFQQSALRSRLVNGTKAAAIKKGVKDAKRVSRDAADSLIAVAKSSTTEEQIAFGQYVQSLNSDEFNPFDTI